MKNKKPCQTKNWKKKLREKDELNFFQFLLFSFVFFYFLNYQRQASSRGFAKLWWLAEIGLGLLVEMGLVSFLFHITLIGFNSLIQIGSFCLIGVKFRFRRMVVIVLISWIRFGCIEIRIVREVKWLIWISFQCLFIIGVWWVFLGAWFGKGFQFSLGFSYYCVLVIMLGS